MMMVDSANLAYWRPSGVMTEFSTSLEIFRATERISYFRTER